MTILITLKNGQEVETNVENQTFEEFAANYYKEIDTTLLITKDAILLKDEIYLIREWS